MIYYELFAYFAWLAIILVNLKDIQFQSNVMHLHDQQNPNYEMKNRKKK